MRKKLYTSLAATIVATALALPAAADAADLDTACFSIHLPDKWSASPDSIEVATNTDGLDAVVTCVRLKGSPEPKDQRDELMQQRLDNEAQYLGNYGRDHDMSVVQPPKRRKIGRFESLMFSVWQRRDGSRFMRYSFLHERAALVAEISYRPSQQAVVDRFVRDSLDRVRWKPHANWDAAY
ncbi:MAG: hypothetical protein CFE46_00805 [Burkholderiales bacterium PBB6]|nr:MAG: hypothetical protein CFE46_00805 [Burkholderiales bacterium PBB6]